MTQDCPSGTWFENATPSKYFRATNACAECKKQKHRCSGRPCARCSRKNIDCVDTYRKDRHNPALWDIIGSFPVPLGTNLVSRLRELKALQDRDAQQQHQQNQQNQQLTYHQQQQQQQHQHQQPRWSPGQGLYTAQQHQEKIEYHIRQLLAEIQQQSTPLPVPYAASAVPHALPPAASAASAAPSAVPPTAHSTAPPAPSAASALGGTAPTAQSTAPVTASALAPGAAAASLPPGAQGTEPSLTEPFLTAPSLAAFFQDVNQRSLGSDRPELLPSMMPASEWAQQMQTPVVGIDHPTQIPSPPPSISSSTSTSTSTSSSSSSSPLSPSSLQHQPDTSESILSMPGPHSAPSQHQEQQNHQHPHQFQHQYQYQHQFRYKNQFQHQPNYPDPNPPTSAVPAIDASASAPPAQSETSAMARPAKHPKPSPPPASQDDDDGPTRKRRQTKASTTTPLRETAPKPRPSWAKPKKQTKSAAAATSTPDASAVEAVDASVITVHAATSTMVTGTPPTAHAGTSPMTTFSTSPTTSFITSATTTTPATTTSPSNATPAKAPSPLREQSAASVHSSQHDAEGEDNNGVWSTQQPMSSLETTAVTGNGKVHANGAWEGYRDTSSAQASQQPSSSQMMMPEAQLDQMDTQMYSPLAQMDNLQAQMHQLQSQMLQPFQSQMYQPMDQSMTQTYQDQNHMYLPQDLTHQHLTRQSQGDMYQPLMSMPMDQGPMYTSLAQLNQDPAQMYLQQAGFNSLMPDAQMLAYQVAAGLLPMNQASLSLDSFPAPDASSSSSSMMFTSPGVPFVPPTPVQGYVSAGGMLDSYHQVSVGLGPAPAPSASVSASADPAPAPSTSTEPPPLGEAKELSPIQEVSDEEEPDSPMVPQSTVTQGMVTREQSTQGQSQTSQGRTWQAQDARGQTSPEQSSQAQGPQRHGQAGSSRDEPLAQGSNTHRPPSRASTPILYFRPDGTVGTTSRSGPAVHRAPSPSHAGVEGACQDGTQPAQPPGPASATASASSQPVEPSFTVPKTVPETKAEFETLLTHQTQILSRQTVLQHRELLGLHELRPGELQEIRQQLKENQRVLRQLQPLLQQYRNARKPFWPSPPPRPTSAEEAEDERGHCAPCTGIPTPRDLRDLEAWRLAEIKEKEASRDKDRMVVRDQPLVTAEGIYHPLYAADLDPSVLPAYTTLPAEDPSRYMNMRRHGLRVEPGAPFTSPSLMAVKVPGFKRGAPALPDVPEQYWHMRHLDEAARAGVHSIVMSWERMAYTDVMRLSHQQLTLNDFRYTINRLLAMDKTHAYQIHPISPSPDLCEILVGNAKFSKETMAFSGRILFRVHQQSSRPCRKRARENPVRFSPNHMGDGIEPEGWWTQPIYGTLSQPDAEVLVARCFDRALPTYRYLFRPVIREYVDHFYRHRGEMRGHDCMNQSAVLFLVLAIGELETPLHSSRCNHGTMALRAQNQIRDSIDGLVKLQARLLLVQYCMLAHRVNAAADELLRAFEMVRRLGYNENAFPRARRNEFEDDITVAEVEGRRRAYWALYLLDVELALIRRKPRLLYDGEAVGVDQPLMVRDEEILGNTTFTMPPRRDDLSSEVFAFRAHIKMARVLACQLHLHHQSSAVGSSQRRDRTNFNQVSIEIWLDAVKSWKQFQLHHRTLPRDLLNRQAEILSLLYCQVLITTYRPFLLTSCLLVSEEKGDVVVFDHLADDYERGISKLVHASLTTVRNLHDLGRVDIRLDAFKAYCAYSAAVMLHLSVTVNEVPSGWWNSCIGDAVLARQLLLRHTHRGTLLERYVIILEEMHRESPGSPHLSMPHGQFFGLTFRHLGGAEARRSRLTPTPAELRELLSENELSASFTHTGKTALGGYATETPLLSVALRQHTEQGQPGEEGSEEWRLFLEIVFGDLDGLRMFVRPTELAKFNLPRSTGKVGFGPPPLLTPPRPGEGSATNPPDTPVAYVIPSPQLSDDSRSSSLTPVPSNMLGPSGSPGLWSTSELSSTPRPFSAQQPSSTPGPSGTPRPSSTPGPSRTPGSSTPGPSTTPGQSSIPPPVAILPNNASAQDVFALLDQQRRQRQRLPYQTLPPSQSPSQAESQSQSKSSGSRQAAQKQPAQYQQLQQSQQQQPQQLSSRQQEKRPQEKRPQQQRPRQSQQSTQQPSSHYSEHFIQQQAQQAQQTQPQRAQHQSQHQSQQQPQQLSARQREKLPERLSQYYPPQFAHLAQPSQPSQPQQLSEKQQGKLPEQPIHPQVRRLQQWEQRQRERQDQQLQELLQYQQLQYQQLQYQHQQQSQESHQQFQQVLASGWPPQPITFFPNTGGSLEAGQTVFRASPQRRAGDMPPPPRPGRA